MVFVLLFMVVFVVVVGLVNGLFMMLLKVLLFIVMLGMMFVLFGGVMWWIGGVVIGNFVDSFWEIGCGGICEVFFFDFLLWVVLFLIVWFVFGIWIIKCFLGKMFIVVGDNFWVVDYVGVCCVWVMI